MNLVKHFESKVEKIKKQGLYRVESKITSLQGYDLTIREDNGQEISFINLAANNYLGLTKNQDILNIAKQTIDDYGIGMASVRLTCGTQTIHQELENKISKFLKVEDTILYSSCYDANAGLFETLLTAEDAIISDELNHASIINGIRLCKAKRYRYKNNDMDSLKNNLENAKNARFKMIVTDGSFSMDGYLANLPDIIDLAKKYNATIMIDESHSTGCIGKGGRGAAEFFGVEGEIDIITSTLGKAITGASGGFTCASKPIIDWLRQRSYPYLFSNSLSPVLVQASSKALDIIQSEVGDKLREKLLFNQNYFREQLTNLGFTVEGSNHPILPVMFDNALTAINFSKHLYKKGIYAKANFFPVVPKDKARIRTIMNASLDKQHLDKSIQIFKEVGQQLNLI